MKSTGSIDVYTCCIVIGLLAIPTLAHATPANTPGIEFSDHTDRSAIGDYDPEQNLNTDGVGTTQDGLDFSNSRATDDNDRQVDALSNNGDAFYHEVTNNNTNLLFSVSNDANVYEHSVMSGTASIWTSPPALDNSIGINDIDALEVWGPPFPRSDAWHYSVARDEATNEVGDFVGDFISVWEYNATLGESVPLFSVEDIANAIGLDPWNQAFLDVDAMMTSGDEIMFSIAPIDTLFDGGEIWVWNGIEGELANYLIHGGHVWDTGFDIADTFGLASENINALEALRPIPLPGSVWLMGFGIAALGFVSRHRNKKSRLCTPSTQLV